MSPEISFEMKGLEELVGKFNDMNEAVRKDDLSDLVRAAADLVVDEARPNLPVAPPGESTPKGHKSGTLRARGVGRMLLKRATNGDAASSGVGFTKRGWYGLFGELGTSHQSARPVIVPAYERKKQDILTMVGQVVAQTISDWRAGGKAGAFKPRSMR